MTRQEQKEHKAFRLTQPWLDHRKRMVEAAGHKCCTCSLLKLKGLGVHHLDPEDYYNLDESKFVVQCWPCHIETHRLTNKKEFILEIYLKKMKEILTYTR